MYIFLGAFSFCHYNLTLGRECIMFLCREYIKRKSFKAEIKLENRRMTFYVGTVYPFRGPIYGNQKRHHFSITLQK